MLGEGWRTKLLLRKAWSLLVSGGNGGTQTGDPAAPRAGDFFAFRTAPYFDPGQPPTGRHGVLKVLKADGKIIVFAVLDWDAEVEPSFEKARRAGVLTEARFKATIGVSTAVYGLIPDIWRPADLTQMRFLGAAAVSARETGLADAVRHYSNLVAASRAAEGEWRWRRDRAAFERELEAARLKDAADEAAREARYNQRLASLTWISFFAEPPLAGWSAYPPANFTAAAREMILEAGRKLQALGEKPRKPAARAVLRACVDGFNAADEAAGGVIETQEREDICAALEDLAWLAGHPDLAQEADGWRRW